ncbi:MAG: DUF4332 domain-containing protein [Ardenticatenaceae bacterium]|nr:DUF4332 domain-containing protein [Ardenticatenaceae bacterium]
MLLLQSFFSLPALNTLFQTSNRGTTPVGVILILLLLVVILFWWGLNRPSYDQIASTADPHATDDHHDDAHATNTHHTNTPAHQPEAAPVVPDNLQRIEGVGPKIAQILNQAGIQTFAQLAVAEVSHLQKIVHEEAGIRIAFPDTWPQQAKLAAVGDWDALATLQENLKGGRTQS